MSVVCSVCGRACDDDAEATLHWSRETDEYGRITHVCPVCTREHVRSIEAKLDQTWW